MWKDYHESGHNTKITCSNNFTAVKKTGTPEKGIPAVIFVIGRGERIRTSGLMDPNHARSPDCATPRKSQGAFYHAKITPSNVKFFAS